MSYRRELNQHLAEYKRTELGIDTPGLFHYRGKALERAHILPVALASANLFPEAAPMANAFLAAHPGARHRSFHHLNSSQAFAFNLFFPYFSGGPEASGALLRALGQPGTLAKWEPEAVPEPDEQSNIDMWWMTTDSVRTFREVKLSERDFGTAKDDDRHREKLRAIYAGPLAGHLEPGQLEPPAFFRAYQFNRNLWHLAKAESSCLIFLMPRSNILLWERLQGLLRGVLPTTRPRLSVVAIEDVIASLCIGPQCSLPGLDYANKLKRKYIIGESASRH